MIRLELNDLQELMQLYQCAMVGKFSGAEVGDSAFLNRPKLANAMDTMVDRLIAEARASHNDVMVEMMEEYRHLQVEYPQYASLLSYTRQLKNAEQAPSEAGLRELLTVAAKPLILSDEIFSQLLTDSDVW